jgi:hypothetical protein
MYKRLMVVASVSVVVPGCRAQTKKVATYCVMMRMLGSGGGDGGRW